MVQHRSNQWRNITRHRLALLFLPQTRKSGFYFSLHVHVPQKSSSHVQSPLIFNSTTPQSNNNPSLCSKFAQKKRDLRVCEEERGRSEEKNHTLSLCASTRNCPQLVGEMVGNISHRRPYSLVPKLESQSSTLVHMFMFQKILLPMFNPHWFSTPTTPQSNNNPCFDSRFAQKLKTKSRQENGPTVYEEERGRREGNKN